MPLSDAERTLFNTELDKARKRLVEQQAVVSSTEAIISSPLALDSLKAIARKRLPKLLQTRDQTFTCIAELEAALNDKPPVQADLDPPSSRPPRSRG